MYEQMIIRIDPEIKVKLAKLARSEGKNTSQVVRELVESYIKERDISAYIDDLWNRIEINMKNSRIPQKDIPRIIRQVRDKNK
jgi:predicted DNA-binding protein